MLDMGATGAELGGSRSAPCVRRSLACERRAIVGEAAEMSASLTSKE